MARDDDDDDWTDRDEAARERDDDDWTARDEARWEYAEDEYEARRARNAHQCQCSGEDWPGSCPGPANCPVADHGDIEDAADDGEDV